MVTVRYFYDPMCGWCYGATDLLEVLISMEGVDVQYHPGGMIQRQPISGGFKQHVLEHDQRISSLTGVHFGDAYKERMKGKDDVVLDSYLATQAILAAKEMGVEPHLMNKAIQKAHYQEGKQVEQLAVLSEIASMFNIDASTFSAKVSEADISLQQALEESHQRMNQQGVKGFPTFIAEINGSNVQLPHTEYYGRTEAWKTYISNLISV